MLSNPNFRVLGLDPGGTTGWFVYDAVIQAGAILEESITPGQLGPQEHHGELYHLLEDLHIQDFWVVCESFEFRQGKQRDNINLIPREYIGVVKLFRDERDLGRRVKFHTAGQSKKFVPDKAVAGMEANAKLKVMGWYTPGMKHANDAARQVVFHLVNHHQRYDLVKQWKDL